MTALPTVDQLRADLPAVLQRFREGKTFAFSFGDGRPEAVVLTYDEFEDLGGETKFDLGDTVLEPAQLATELPQLVAALRTGAVPAPQVWGDQGEPEAVILSTTQYRHLRGDDQPHQALTTTPPNAPTPPNPSPTANPSTWMRSQS